MGDATFIDELSQNPEDLAFRIGSRSVTRGELAKASIGMASTLHDLGLRRGDVVCIWLPDGGSWLQTLIACAHAGIRVVPLSTRYRAPEAEHVLRTSRAKAILVVNDFLKSDYVKMISEIQDGLPDLQHVLTISADDLFWPTPDGVTDSGAASDSSEPLCAFTTSGTTSRPKLAMHDQASIVTHSRIVAERLNIKRGDSMLCALPLYGVLGFSAAMAALLGGASCNFLPVFDAEEAATLMANHRVTHLYASDGLIDRVLEVEHADLSSWREGGFAEFAGLGESVARRAEARWGVRLVSVYGSSECLAFTALRSSEDELTRRVPIGGGLASDRIQFRVTDLENGTQVAAGAAGELQIRGYNVMSGYLHNPEATANAFTQDGWYRTGDYATSQGAEFTFLSRLGDALRLRGYLVDPAEVECCLAGHTSVNAAQVVGVKRPGEGDVAVAFVVGRADAADEDDLVAFCRDRMANYKVPSRIVFIDNFPSVEGPNGTKILKTELRKMAEAVIPQAKEMANEAR